MRDGILREVGPTRRVENLAPAREAIEIDAAGRVVMPGFVDSHTHLLFPPPGAPSGDLASSSRIVNTTTASQLRLRAARYLQAMARHGTTTVEVKTGSGAGVHEEMKMLRVLSELKHDLLDVVPTFLFRPPPISFDAEAASLENWKWVRAELLPRISQRRLSEFADLQWDDFTESLWQGCPSRAAWLTGYFQVARSLGFRCKLHADTGSMAAAAIASLQYRMASIDHLEYATETEVSVLSRSEGIATLLPAASFHSGKPYAPGRELIDAGAAVALATNFNTRETPSLSMQTAIALACEHMQLTPAEAVSAATINGAYALDRGAAIGSLECGKSADLLLLNVSDYRELAHCLGTNLVHTVMKRGEIIYREGEVRPLASDELPPAW